MLSAIKAIALGLTEGLGSITFILAYVAFGFAAAGLANASRHRWEDLAIRTPSDSSLPLFREAKTQAELDFHNWFKYMFLISGVAEALTILCLFLVDSNRWKLLPLSFILVFTGLCFFIKTYLRERKEFRLDPTRA